MGREMRRKEERKNKKKTEKRQEELDFDIKGITIIKLVSFVAIFLFVLYLVIAVFVTKEISISDSNTEKTTEKESESTNENISNRILASTTFEQKESVYYVYYYDFNEADEVIDSAISNKSDSKFYRVDTSSSLNKNYVTEDNGNKNVTGIENLKVKNPTLLQITNDKVTAYYEGVNPIINYLEK